MYMDGHYEVGGALPPLPLSSARFPTSVSLTRTVLSSIDGISLEEFPPTPQLLSHVRT